MRPLAALPSDLRLSFVEAPAKWFGARLMVYAFAVGVVTVIAFCVLAVFGPAIYSDQVSPDAQSLDRAPALQIDNGSGGDAPTLPVDDAMLVAGEIDRGKFITLPVSGSSVVDGSGKRVGALKEVIIGQNDNVVGIVVRRSSGWLAGSRDIVVPANLYRFSNDRQFSAGDPSKAAREVATIDLSSAQIDALPTVSSLGK